MPKAWQSERVEALKKLKLLDERNQIMANLIRTYGLLAICEGLKEAKDPDKIWRIQEFDKRIEPWVYKQIEQGKRLTDVIREVTFTAEGKDLHPQIGKQMRKMADNGTTPTIKEKEHCDKDTYLKKGLCFKCGIH